MIDDLLYWVSSVLLRWWMNQVLLLMYSKICYAILLQIDATLCHGVKCLLQFGYDRGVKLMFGVMII